MSRRVFSGGRVTCAASRVSVLDFISVPKATITQRPRLFQGGAGRSAQMESKFGGKGRGAGAIEDDSGTDNEIKPRISISVPRWVRRPPLSPRFDSTLLGSTRRP